MILPAAVFKSHELLELKGSLRSFRSILFLLQQRKPTLERLGGKDLGPSLPALGLCPFLNNVPCQPKQIITVSNFSFPLPIMEEHTLGSRLALRSLQAMQLLPGGGPLPVPESGFLSNIRKLIV